ncbi:molybdopterin-binding protein [Arcobacter sp. LA11]|uniref:competence/damage-inducible protein A n=1 Tax=Arcobacter sp. LA11 TaxID=1898176 RepID=UPI000933B465|nr:molybdopterin-binding protein [Arcobacter sp. LA11]
MNFYSVIIGTELLNGRRKDAHFAFLNEQLLKRGWTHKASFVIEDDVDLMKNIFELILADKDSVMFCFGGIGATPDDYTRKIAAEVFRKGKMEFHPKAKELIENQFKQEAYPHRINMSYLPTKAKLLKNVVNNVPGFYLDNRFFFTPGFPSMSQSMIVEALDKYYLKNDIKKYRSTLVASCGENELINIMQTIPYNIELSSLPRIKGEKREVEVSLLSKSKEETNKYFKLFLDYLIKNNIEYLVK